MLIPLTDVGQTLVSQMSPFLAQWAMPTCLLLLPRAGVLLETLGHRQEWGLTLSSVPAAKSCQAPAQVHMLGCAGPLF